MNFKTLQKLMMRNNREKKIFLVLRITVKIIMSQISLSVPSEGAEVGHVISIQAEEQISGFGTLFFKDS